MEPYKAKKLPFNYELENFYVMRKKHMENIKVFLRV